MEDMPILAETKIDKSKIYFHGSSEARVEKLEAPSFQHPFYVTSDLHYAMAFCTKSQSSTGDYEVKKTFTPADQNYVYVVTLKPTCYVFDFRDKSSPEFKKLYSIIDKEIVDWVLNSANDLDFDDIYEFIIGLDQELLSKIENYSTYQQYYEASHYTSRKPLETIGKVITQSVFEKAKTFALNNGIQKASELDIHEIMAPILKKLNKIGFQGVLTKEHDYNNEVDWIRITPAKVTTDYAIGIFDKAGLDIVGLVPMRYKWLKKINPDYWYNSTSETAAQKIKRFIQLYKKMHMKRVNESALDKKSTWYFGNNRTKNLKLSPPKWHSPFFLTTDYSYAEQYSDYGVYTVSLKGEAKSKILDFDKDSDVKKLKWPKELIDDIRTGKSDLNGIAYDMYILAGHGHSQEVFDKSWYLSDAAYDFDVRSENIFDIVPKHASWASEKDHRFVLQMWKDIHDAGFDGFTHFEFGKQILALFDFKCMDKISIKPAAKKIDESKQTYLQKYADEPDAKKIVDSFWAIKQRLSAPQNDIDWWIKKPFADLKRFVQTYDTSNKKQRRDIDYRRQAVDNDAKLLGTRDGYEIWYVPTYEAMRILGRFYKGRSAKWCVASDDPEFWFDNHDEDEFVVLVREHPKNDEFDKVALQMTSHGRYFNQKQIIPWDLENNDNTFTARYYMTGLDLEDVEDLIYYAWQLFKDNGEQREQYYNAD